MVDQPLTERDLELAYAAGVEDTEQRLLPFRGVGRVRFATEVCQLLAAQAYELDLIPELFAITERLERACRKQQLAMDDHATAFMTARQTHRGRKMIEGANALVRLVRHLHACWKADARERLTEQQMHDSVQARAALELEQARTGAELENVRHWLDEQVVIAQEYAAARTGRRRENQLPYELVRYPDASVFFDEDPRRALEPGSRHCGGRLYGRRWTLERPGSPLDITTWAIYWLEHGEIYARDITNGPSPGLSEHGILLPGRHDDGVLLLGCLPYPARRSDDDMFLIELQQTVMRERNSLAAVAEAIVERQKTLASRPRANADSDY